MTAPTHVFFYDARVDGRWRCQQQVRITLPEDADLEVLRHTLLADVMARQGLSRGDVRRHFIVSASWADDPEFSPPPEGTSPFGRLVFYFVAIVGAVLLVQGVIELLPQGWLPAWANPRGR